MRLHARTGKAETMNRRSFISALIASAVAPAFLPGTGRIWRPEVHGLAVMEIPMAASGYDYYCQIHPATREWIRMTSTASGVIFHEIIHRPYEENPQTRAYLL